MSIVLETAEGKSLEMPQKDLQLSGTIVKLLQDLDGSEPLPVPCVDFDTLKRVAAWCSHYSDYPQHGRLPAEALPTEVPVQQASQRLDEWDQAFFPQDPTQLLKLIEAADYLDIPGLVDRTAERIAEQMRGKSAEEMRALFTK